MKPVTGRNDSYKLVLDLLEKTFTFPIVIVETGCIRNETDQFKMGDGWSTLNWEYYCKKTNSRLFSVDINEQHVNVSKKIVPESEYVKYHVGDSVSYLKDFTEPIHMLFLDSYDYCGDDENIRKCHEHSLNELLASWHTLNDKCFVLIDDVFDDTWTGKGKKSIPYLLNNGFALVYFTDSQALLKR
jgi:hypothetical protein